jgi:CubicO group peptidase (beta-lactamase class C family)
MNDSGGAGALSTANDYLRFEQMLLNGGELDGVRVLSRSTIKLMTSDHLGTRIAAPLQPGELLLGTPGYTFGLGFAVRQADGVAGVPGSAGEFMWAGYAGTYFWVDPKEEIAAVYMTQAPSPIRAYYRKMGRAAAASLRYCFRKLSTSSKNGKRFFSNKTKWVASGIKMLRLTGACTRSRMSPWRSSG